MQNTFQLIGLAANRPKAGKSEFSTALAAFGFETFEYSAPMRETAQVLYGLSDDETWDDELKDTPIERLTGMTPRQLFQLVVKAGYAAHPELWSMRMGDKIDAARARGVVGAVASGVRRDKEADFIRDQGGIMVHLYRPVPEADFLGAAMQDEAEAGISFRPDLGDVRIENTGSLADLHATVQRFYQHLVTMEG